MKSYDYYLGGRWAGASERFRVVDPGTGEAFAEVASAGRPEARAAVEQAHAAFAGWRALPAMKRGDCLLAMAEWLRSRQEEIARLITRENGKPLAQSRAETAMSIDHFRWFAEEARRAYGRVVPHQAAGKRHLVLKHPVGVVGAIPPWNFPLVLSARKVAPALAAGCPVILRPSQKTPLCALELARAAEAAGLPAGVLQVLTGPAEPIVTELLDNPLCRKITFTGSTEVGRRLLARSAGADALGSGGGQGQAAAGVGEEQATVGRRPSGSLTRLSLELGGHAAVLVFADADLNQAVEGAIVTKFRNTGQSCIAANRIFVQRPIYERFLEQFVARARSLKVGYGLEEGVEIGPLISREALHKALDHVQNAVAAGARRLSGGRPLEIGGGFYLEPTVLAEVPETALCMREETFAPVAPVCPFDTEAEALAQANASRYGLAAYAFTRDLNRAWRLAEELEAGTIGINDAVPPTSNCPFGGMKDSGLGRELGLEGLEAFLETKHISFGGLQ
jgi:succinate-semialdehyde dehydrogenase/glutarate-semialdehyde dehydrogenase